MINTINITTNFTPYGYNANFRSNYDCPLCLDFKPKLRPQLVTDVFERSTSGGIVSSKKTAEKAEKLLPYREFHEFVDSNTRETKRNEKIEQEKNHIAKTITKRTETNKRKLRSAGISERDVKKYLTIDGHINDAGKRILREKGISY